MLELRWLEREEPHPKYENVGQLARVLQYREGDYFKSFGAQFGAAIGTAWRGTDWRDVPTVTEQEAA